MLGHEEQQEDLDQRTQEHSGEIAYENLAAQQLEASRPACRHMSNDDAFLMGNKSPIITVESMEDDTQI